MINEKTEITKNKSQLIELYRENKDSIRFIIIAVFLFVTLKVCFHGYVALVDSKGNFYFPWLAKYSLIQLILNCIIYPSKVILSSLGYHVYHSYNFITVDGSSVQIAFPCLGVEMMIAIVSLITAYPNGTHKIKAIILGILLIHIINIFRVSGLVLVGLYNLGTVKQMHDYYNTMVYIFAIIYFLVYMSKFSKKIDKVWSL